MKKYDAALKKLEKAREIFEKINRDINIESSYLFEVLNYLGKCYELSDDSARAIENYEKASIILEKAKISPSSRIHHAKFYKSFVKQLLAQAYSNTLRGKDSVCEKVSSLIEKMGNLRTKIKTQKTYFIIDCDYFLAMALMLGKKWSEAKECLDKYKKFFDSYTGPKENLKKARYFELKALFYSEKYSKKHLQYKKNLEQALELYKTIDPNHKKVEEIILSFTKLK